MIGTLAAPRPADRRLVVGAAVVAGGVLAAVLGLTWPVPVFGAMLAVLLVVGLVRWPFAVLAAAFALIPFHFAFYEALTQRMHSNVGQLTLWKDVMIGGLLLRGLVHRWRNGGLRVSRSMADNYLVLYILVLGFLAIASPRLVPAGYAYALDIEGPLLLLAVLLLEPSRRALNACILAIVGVTVVMSGAALIEQGLGASFPRWWGFQPSSEVFYSDPLHQTGYRSGSFFGDSLELGFYLCGATALTIGAAMMFRGWARAVLSAVAVLAAAGVVVTFTRSAYAGAGVAAIIMLLLGIRNPATRLSVVGLFVVVTAGSAVLWAQSGDNRLTHSADASVHFDLIRDDFDVISSYPLGYGIGSTDTVARRFGSGFQSQTVTLNNESADIGPSAESVFLGRAVEGGVVGFLGYIAALFITGMRLRSLRRAALRHGDGRGALIAAAALAGLIGISVAGVFLPVRGLSIQILMWGVCGIAIAYQSGRARPRRTVSAT